MGTTATANPAQGTFLYTLANGNAVYADGNGGTITGGVPSAGTLLYTNADGSRGYADGNGNINVLPAGLSYAQFQSEFAPPAQGVVLSVDGTSHTVILADGQGGQTFQSFATATDGTYLGEDVVGNRYWVGPGQVVIGVPPGGQAYSPAPKMAASPLAVSLDYPNGVPTAQQITPTRDTPIASPLAIASPVVTVFAQIEASVPAGGIKLGSYTIPRQTLLLLGGLGAFLLILKAL